MEISALKYTRVQEISALNNIKMNVEERMVNDHKKILHGTFTVGSNVYESEIGLKKG